MEGGERERVRVGERGTERERFEDAPLLALKMKEGEKARKQISP